MKKHRMKVIVALVLVLALVGGCSSAPGNQAAPIEDGDFTVTLSVSVEELLGNMDALDPEKHELVPFDGLIFPSTDVAVREGESVFDILQREMRGAGIHMAFGTMPVYGTAYITGINNIFASDAGPLSGWIYRVNGVLPDVGPSLYLPEPGDVIEWIYIVDFSEMDW